MSGAIPMLKEALRLIYVVDAEQSADWRRVEQTLEGGVTTLWLRVPHATGSELYRLGKDLQQRCRARGAALVVGDRADVALALGAEGVQLGHRSPPAHRVRAWFPGWLGVSCHTEGDLARAQQAGVDYVVLSPVYGVPDKGAPLGPLLFDKLRVGVSLPVVALGGIEVENAAEVAAVGAAGVAVVRALRDAPDPLGAARQLRVAMTRT